MTRSFLKSSWTTAGYDPSFMAGYAKSVVFPSSSTLPELVIAAFGGNHPEFAYKMYVLVSAAAVPWLIALACVLLENSRPGEWRSPSCSICSTSGPTSRSTTSFWGMLPYFLAIPVGLAATGAFGRFLTGRGLINWLISASLMSLAFLIHFTTAMIIVPAAALAYCRGGHTSFEASRRRGATSARSRLGLEWTRVRNRRMSAWFHLAVWMIPIIVLTVNAFWWLPGIWLASTKGRAALRSPIPRASMRRFVADRGFIERRAGSEHFARGGLAGIVRGLAAQLD